MSILNYVLYFLSGIFLNMSLLHLANFSETKRHPMIARTKSPKLASTLWGLFQLSLGVLILLLLHYQFELSLTTACIFFGFGAWGVFVAAMSDRADRRRGELA
jgi:hypothetical protein